MQSSAVAEEPGTGASWVGENLDGVGGWSTRNRAPWLLGLLMLFDSWDSLVIAFALPVLVGQWHLQPKQTGLIISAGYAAQFAGALISGVIAERYGRLPVLRILVALMSVLAIACAMAANFDQLLLLRSAQGLMIGGALPIAICYINEIAPTRTRGRFFGTFQFLMTSGFGLASLVSAWIVPMPEGWRIMFALGAAPLLVLPFTMSLPESPRWLAGRGRAEEADRSLEKLGSGAGPPSGARPAIAGSGERVPVALLFEPRVRKLSIVMALLWFFTSFVSFGMSSWIPTLYVSMFKIPLADALRYNIIVSISIFIIPLVLKWSIDRIGRRPLPIVGTAIGGVALLAMILVGVDATLVLVTLSIIGQIGISIGSMALWPYTAESYATRVRSLALGTASSLARAASMLTPLLVGGVLQATGSATPIFVVFGAASLMVAGMWLFGTRETAGRKMID